MSVEFYPAAQQGHATLNGFGRDIALLPGGTAQDRYDATLAALQDACDIAGGDAVSATFLGERLLGWDSVAYPADYAADKMDVYTAFPTGDDRPKNWPSVESDKVAIDAVLAAMAPP